MAKGVLDQGQGLGRQGVGKAAQMLLPVWPARPLHPWVPGERELQGEEGASSGAEGMTDCLGLGGPRAENLILGK